MGARQYRDRYFSIYPEQVGWSEAEVWRFKERFGINVIRENVPIFLRLQIVGTLRTIVDSAYPERLLRNVDWRAASAKLFRTDGLSLPQRLYQAGWPVWTKLLMYVFNSAALFLCLYGLARFQSKDFVFWTLCLAMLCFVIVPGLQGADRFRLPILSFFLLFVASGLRGLLESASRHRDTPRIRHSRVARESKLASHRHPCSARWIEVVAGKNFFSLGQLLWTCSIA